MAFLIFAEEGVDRVVLEVGLGGRLDATNVVRPSLAVITPIDFDHESFLGRGIESIAARGRYSETRRARRFRRANAGSRPCAGPPRRRMDIPVTRAASAFIQKLSLDARGSRFELSGATPLSIRCPLAGEHQAENAVTAALALLRLAVCDRRSN